MAEQVRRRDGLYSLSVTAQLMCKFIVFFTPIIQRLYGGNVALLAALAAANLACHELSVQVNAQKEQGV